MAVAWSPGPGSRPGLLAARRPFFAAFLSRVTGPVPPAPASAPGVLEALVDRPLDWNKKRTYGMEHTANIRRRNMRVMRQILEGAAFGTLMAVILVGQHLLQ
jgi:hypothetical protein